MNFLGTDQIAERRAADAEHFSAMKHKKRREELAVNLLQTMLSQVGEDRRRADWAERISTEALQLAEAFLTAARDFKP